MRILFVSSETPIFPAGGIATYLEYLVPALEAAGHDVFLFTFQNEMGFIPPQDTAPFKSDHVHIELIEEAEVYRHFPSRSHFQSTSFAIADSITALADAWQIDVIEATDYQAPCLALFQQLQTRYGAEKRLLTTFHHGLSEVIFEADQIGYPDWARANSIAERQQMRISDLIVAPSTASAERLNSLDIRNEIVIVREPFAFNNAPRQFTEVRQEIQYMGRLSIQKGIDKLVYAANSLHSVLPLNRVELIGRIGFTSFRQNDIIKYIRTRLRPELRDKFIYIDFKPRNVARDLLTSEAISPHLGTDETFSYACIEAIDAGQLPIVRHGTAMAEFFPEDVQDYILDSQMRSMRGMQKKFDRIVENAPKIAARVQEHCRETLEPSRIASDLGSVYEKALDRKRGWKAHAVARTRATISDVTVLIPVYKPDADFMETIDSIAWQTAGTPRVLICDDGTPESHQPWFSYATARLPEARIVRQTNGGLLAARNTLIEECESDLAIFIDADDLFAPNLLEHLLEAWNESPRQPNAVIPQRQNFGETNELILRHLLDDYMHFLENDYRMTSLIRTDILREIGFDSTRRNGEGDDWVFWLEFVSRGYSGLLLPEPSFLYRFYSGSMSWPWSQGQNVGTQTMLRETIDKMCLRNPQKITALARALFTQRVSR